MAVDKDFCASSCLAFRYVAREGVGWREGLVPDYPHLEAGRQIAVKNADEVLTALRSIIERDVTKDSAILLSGGMDSAVLAALLGEGTPAYTIRFMAEGAVDESIQAGRYAERYGLSHRVVNITWKDYEEYADALMRRKKAPLHPVEVGLYKTGLRAKSEGIDKLILGNGADSTFGGLDKLLSQDWTFDAFVKRYSFVQPQDVLKRPVSVLEPYERYRRPGGIDVIGFLKVVHGLGVVQAFENAIHAAGCSIVAPYEDLILDAPLDMKRIRGGQSKYILREVFDRLYPGMGQPDKIAFARPMDRWLGSWPGPHRDEFRDDLDPGALTGDQRWIVYCLERFLDIHAL